MARRNRHLIFTMTTTLAALAFAGAAFAQNSNEGWYKALNARSEALNQRYGLGDYARTVSQSNAPAWLQALNARSEALNRRYGLATNAGAQTPNDRSGTIGVGAVTASAQTLSSGSPNDQAGTIGVGSVATSTQAPDAFERAAIRATVQAPDAFERAAIRATADTAVRPDDRAGIRGPGIVPTGSVLVATSAENGFQWGDASLGAGFAFGLVLVLGLVGLTIRHRGGPVSA